MTSGKGEAAEAINVYFINKVDTLRAAALAANMTPVEFAYWDDAFEVYHAGSHMEVANVAVQQAFFKACVHPLLYGRIKSNIVSGVTPVLGQGATVMVLMRDKFMLEHPLLSLRLVKDARHSYAARLDKVYMQGFPDATSKVLEDKTTDHHPVLTTIKTGGGHKHFIKLKRRNFKAIRRDTLEAALNQHDWTGIYSVKDVEEVHKFVIDGIIAALDDVAPVKEIVIKMGSNLCLSKETLEMMKRRDLAKAGTQRFRVLRNATNRLVKRDKLTSNAETSQVQQ
jgi:hypothetical protein